MLAGKADKEPVKGEFMIAHLELKTANSKNDYFEVASIPGFTNNFEEA